MMEKVDEGSRKRWKESLDFVKLPSWESFIEIIDRRCQFLESMETAGHVEPKRVTKSNHSVKRSSFVMGKSNCQLCGSHDHQLHNCYRFKDLDALKRYYKAKELRVCLNCLAGGHLASRCPSKGRCRQCGGSHHTLLHRGQSTQQPCQHHVTQPSGQLNPSSGQVSTSHSHFDRSSDHILLATAVLLLRGADGVYHPGRALLDSCSQVNFVTDRFAQLLRVRRKRGNLQIFGVGDSPATVKQIVSTTLKSRFTEFEMPLEFCVTPRISYQPEPDVDITTWNLPKNIPLADEQFNKSKPVDLLIGTEGFFDLLSVGQIKLGPNMPTLQKTLLGWVVSGRCNGRKETIASRKCLLTVEESIDAKLERMWLLEEFVNTVSRSEEGRVIVRLPLKEGSASLGKSLEIAQRRLLLQERRLQRQPELRDQYVEFMKEFKDLGHMQLVKDPKLERPHYYIPHHCVLKPTSTSTKLRVVFDASCKTTTQFSLNDLLRVGPSIQDDLYTLILKFRLYRYALLADIVKMVRQILLHEDDRRFQYIVWRDDPRKEINTYRINTVAYGTALAPYLAVRALHYLADTYALELPLGAQVIKKSFYVDDFLFGSDDVEELVRVKSEVSEILKRGCMELAKWHSNHPRFVDDSTIKDLNMDDGFITSALGVAWDQGKDAFLFRFKLESVELRKITKRSILSVTASLFDPLGLLSPVVVRAKILIQELWLRKVGWDESIPQVIQSVWQDLLSDLQSLSTLTIPRYCLAPDRVNIQLHGFCDASIRAYGSCLYLRVVDTHGQVSVSLVTARSKVAPTKKRTLPQLELCGAKLLAALFEDTKSTLGFLTSEVYLWSDSQIMLYWLRQQSATLSAFVGNRVSDIQEMTSERKWRHVPTKCNPADIVSRGCCVGELSTAIWFTGPAVLRLKDTHWPENTHVTPITEDVSKERRKFAFHAEINPNALLDCIERFSTYNKMLRVVAWVFRFVKKPAEEEGCPAFELTAYELQRALWCIVWNIQQRDFYEDIRRIRKSQPTQGPLKGLNPFIEESFGFPILKVGGRLELAEVPITQNHPAILSTKTHFSLCYVRHLHLANYHAGAKALVGLVRNGFWIINARDVWRRIVRSCVHCVRYKPRLLHQMMGDLPSERLTVCRPFQRCAVDFCGPIDTYMRIRGRPPSKTYIAVFVCMATKAVHIELVSDLSTDAFLEALKRLIGRRGLPSDLFCDNATNFVGASNRLAALKEFFFKEETKHAVVSFCSNQFINFRFIPPRAPHFGGLWEAAVKSAKSLLNRTLANVRMTYEELYTAMVEIEAILNSRPISPLSSDPNDLEALTPAHFIIGGSLKALPESTLYPKDVNLLGYWARITAVKQQFWKQWSQDYLNELQGRTKWTHETTNVENGCMVLVHEDNLPPKKWAIGRIVDCIPGKDGRVRVVDIRCAKGVIRRPIRKIALLPA